MQSRAPMLIKFSALILAIAAITGAFSALTLEKELPTAGAPNEKKDRLTVILDAGHGGEDGGAVSADGSAVEKALNLEMARLVGEILTAAGVNVVMTRTEDILLYDRTVDYHGRKKVLDLAARRKIGEETPNSLFVSIHMNAYPLSQYHGLQVWYSPNNEDSHPLAEAIRASVCNTLQPENHRKVKSATSSIYLLHHLTSPAVLVECGFLSNPQEAARLSSTDYQKQLALAIAMGILES